MISRMVDELFFKEYGVGTIKNDRGGPTAHGVTLETAKEYGYSSIYEITPKIAKLIFEDKYFNKPKLNIIPDHRLQWRMVVDGLNSGSRTINKRLQRLLNSHNRQERDYKDIVVDGYLGQKTLRALSSFKRVSIIRYGDLSHEIDNPSELFWFHVCEEMKALQFSLYFNLSENDETQEDFFNGWRNRIAFEPNFYKFNYSIKYRGHE